MGIKHSVSYQNGENMAKKTDEELYDVAINMIGSVAKLPVIRVDREAFLRQQFADSEYLDEILEHGPQHVYTVESLRKKADGVIKKSTDQTTLAAFVAGNPGGFLSLLCKNPPADLPPLPPEVPMWPSILASRSI